MMTVGAEWANIIQVVSAIAGLAGSLIAGLSWLFERKTRRRLQLENKRRIWTDISKIRGLMTDLEKDADQFGAEPGRMQAIGKLSFMMRDLIREACMAERKLSVDVIRKWRRVGKLASDWQESLALNVLQSEEISDLQADKLPDSLRSSDELPEGNPARAPSGARASSPAVQTT